MGFRKDAWAKIWSVERGERSTKVRLSISKKNKQTEQYEQDFSGFVTLAGTAHRDGANLKEGDRIKIGDCDVTNRYDKEQKKEYTNFVVYSFENGDVQNNTADPKPAAAPVSIADDEDDGDLPF